MGEPGIDSPRAPRTPPPEDLGDSRSEIITVSGLNTLVGAWLVASPFVLGYGAADSYWNPIVFGAIVMVLAVTRVTVPASRTVWVSVVNGVIGVWLFLSAFWLGVSGEAITNSWIMGVFVLALASWSAVTTGAGRGARPGTEE